MKVNVLRNARLCAVSTCDHGKYALPRLKTNHTNSPSPFFPLTNPPANSIPLPLPQHIGKFIQRAPHQLRFLPQIGRQETIGVADGHEGGFEGVFEGFGGAGRGGVGVFHAGELEETFYGGGGDEAGAAGGGDELLCSVS